MRTYTYTPSINILRDFDQELNYIATPNANQVYGQIVSNYQKGSRSFNIIGTYGTGKSAFIVALEQSLNSKHEVFNKARLFNGINSFEFVNVIGENTSLIDSFAKRFGVDNSDFTSSDVINAIDEYQEDIDGALILVVDEFGKFLEFAAENNTEKELYFIQQIAELANDRKKEILFITILHQNFNAYSRELNKSQVEEWNKVKGRLVELNFNEPVEQLLLLASEKIQAIQSQYLTNENIAPLNDSIKESKLFPLRDYNNLEFSNKLYPFDLLSASILTLSLQEYAQNERSLFSFIENDDELGLGKFDQDRSPFYNISCVYDYLSFYHHSFLATKFNPHLNQWNAIKNAIEKSESIFESNYYEVSGLIKTIGLLNIFSKKGGIIDRSFIEDYGKYSLGIKNPWVIVEELIKKSILHITKYDNRIKIKEGTDLDFEIAINEAGNLVEQIKDVTSSLNKYFDFPVLSAKRISYTRGTPRFFNFVLSDEPISKTPKNEIDGFINLIFSKSISEQEIQLSSRNCKEAILYGWYTKTDKILDTIFEIEKINKVIERNADDLVAVRELKVILNHYQSLLNHFVVDSLYAGEGNIMWYFNGNRVNIDNQRDFNDQLSLICREIYPSTPEFKNEMINKTKISGSISSARKNLFKRLLNDFEKESFGFENEKFPPEKTIFLSLIQKTGMYAFENGISVLKEPNEESFQYLWNYSLNFLEQSRQVRKPITELIEGLSEKPFKLKQGFIDFWLPLFLVYFKDEFALFHKDKLTGKLTYIPFLNEDVLDLIYRTPKDYLVKMFDLNENKLRIFNKYREVLNQIEPTSTQSTMLGLGMPGTISVP